MGSVLVCQAPHIHPCLLSGTAAPCSISDAVTALRGTSLSLFGSSTAPGRLQLVLGEVMPAGHGAVQAGAGKAWAVRAGVSARSQDGH